MTRLARRTNTAVCGILNGRSVENAPTPRSWVGAHASSVPDTLRNFSGEEIDVIMAHEFAIM